MLLPQSSTEETEADFTMDLDSGIFIPCEPGDERECLTALQAVMKESKNTAVTPDKKHGGLRLVFPDPSQARDILDMRRVSRFPVYPLSTPLVIHTDQSKFSDDFPQLLRDALEDLGPVVDVCRIPFLENMPDFFTNDWKVMLGVPEKGDLEPFQRAGLPGDMTLKLPGFETELRVTFCCSSCKGEHVTWNCPSKITVKSETQSSRIDSVAATKGEDSIGITTPSETSSEFRIRDRREEKGLQMNESLKKPLKRPIDYESLKKPLKRPIDYESMAQKIGEEQVLSTFGNSLLSISPEKKVPKIEIGDSSTPHKGNLMPNLPFPFIPLTPGASSDSDKDVIMVGAFPSPQKNTMMKDSGNNIGSSIEESAQVPTSSLPDGFSDMKSELPSTDSDSNAEPFPLAFTPSNKNPKPRKTTTPDFSVHIPGPIRDIIEDTPGVLDVTRLEAFFNNVKKKSSPCMVAKQYTDDENGLKAQLQNIKDKYYHTPVMRSVKEKQFMKWFEPMLDRFDRKPCVKPRKKTVSASLQQMQP